MGPKFGIPVNWDFGEPSLLRRFRRRTRHRKALRVRGQYPPTKSRYTCRCNRSADRSVLGHTTMKQVQTYRKQADQLLLAQGAQKKREEMYERERLAAMIDMAGNVTKLRA